MSAAVDAAPKPAAPPPRFTPAHLLTGFLGSGKTTLLRRMLSDPALAGAAVLINEFGEVGLDHDLLERIDETTVLLQSGCLCCTIRGELADAVRGLLDRRESGAIPAFDRLVIESTGLADPFPILSTLRADPIASQHFRIGATIATVDAVNGAAGLAHRAELRRQVAAADRIVLTKSDLVAPEAASALLARLAALNPAAVVRDAHDPACAPGWLIADADASPRDAVAPDHAHAHGVGAVAFAIEPQGAVDWTAFGVWLSMLLNRHGDGILRVKGILAIDGEDAPVAVHGVQRLVHAPTHMAAWPDGRRASRLVFIVEGIDPQAVRRSFACFVGGGRGVG
ncbi:CobW family GTP-binding protein [Rubrimonas cliftonensis]|uniref:CobW family GTP-binding protein n=1 Tax=Rubrimonas cliftonensis TaxID=89524 RepID=UPI001FE1BB21|nr:GTP-binding protein [Rubrimonas cliftonensis]